jgi:endonuclease/exonuclease/phosphatase family metal-dependent hydrolase
MDGDASVTLSHQIILVGALVATAGALSADQSQGSFEREPITIDVMTFNIRTSEGRDGDDAWPLRRELVAETIGRSNAHVVGLQEVLAEQTEYLEAALPQYRWLGIDRGLNGGTGLSEATPIFYRHAEIAPIESGTFWLGNAPSDSSPRRGGSRIVTWARFHHFATGQQIYVFNTHFTLREGQQQFESAALINARIAALPPGSAVIVMGDFNAYAGFSDTWKIATSEGLLDAWELAVNFKRPPFTPSIRSWKIFSSAWRANAMSGIASCTVPAQLNWTGFWKF